MEALLESLVFDGTGRPLPKYTLESDGLEGLFGGSGVRRDGVARPAQHGGYSLPGYRDPRGFKLSGLVHSESWFGQENDLNAISSVLGDGGRGALTLQSEGSTRWAMVELADSPRCEVLVYGSIARYQLLLRAPDPRLYGTVHTFKGSPVDVHHLGNFPASPVVEVVGPRAAYTVSGPGGRSVNVTQALTAGQTHRIDFRTGRIYRNNVLQVGALGRVNTWTIPPGRQTGMSISSGSMTVTVADTYM